MSSSSSRRSLSESHSRDPRRRFARIYEECTPFGKYILAMMAERSYSAEMVIRELGIERSSFYVGFLRTRMKITDPQKYLLRLAHSFHLPLTKLVTLYFFGEDVVVGEDERVLAQTLAHLAIYLSLSDEDKAMAEMVIDALATRAQEKAQEKEREKAKARGEE